MDNVNVLKKEAEDLIKAFIEKQFRRDGLESAFPNRLLRDDVLELLDRYCTVVYYPLENEENNGFHITDIPFSDGTKHNFVFINTAQTIEKQVFTAAHELGHIWNVDDYVIQKLKCEGSTDTREMIINRFAAVLLIPAENFKMSVRAGVDELGDREKQTITFGNLLRLVVILMNQFYVPMKAIVLRFAELGIFQDHIVDLLLGRGELPAGDLELLVKEQITEMGYTRFLSPTRKKWIEGLSEKLEIAERENLADPRKIAHMRKMFDLKNGAAEIPEWNISLDTTREGLDRK